MPLADLDCLITAAKTALKQPGQISSSALEEIERDLKRGLDISGRPEHISRDLWASYAGMAKHRGDFAEYRTRLEAAYLQCPACPTISSGLADARELAPRDEDIQASATADGMMRFESLGGGGSRGGCELGIMQRYFGAEPLGLLRWASIQPAQLATLLENRFVGLGEESTLEIRPQGTYDWGCTETTYGIKVDHTHMSQTAIGEDAARKVMSRQMTFLARKMIADLELGEKIFVYQTAGRDLPSDAMDRIYRAVSSYGPGRIVFVTEMVSPDPIFDAWLVRPRCVAIRRNVQPQSEAPANWQKICAVADDLFAENAADAGRY